MSFIRKLCDEVPPASVGVRESGVAGGEGLRGIIFTPLPLKPPKTPGYANSVTFKVSNSFQLDGGGGLFLN